MKRCFCTALLLGMAVLGLAQPVGHGLLPLLSPEPVFSHERGFYGGSLLLTLSLPGGIGTIRYTRDGSIPDTLSVAYTDPLVIDSTTVIRARGFLNGAWPSPVVTHTFLINDSTDLPVFSLTTNPPNLWDLDYGIYVEGRDYIWGWGNGNFWQDWEREVFVEFFEQDRLPKIAQSAGIKISGALTRTASQKSLRLIARDQYGASKFDYPVFRDKRIESFKDIKLRSSGNDWAFSMMKDGLLQTLLAGQMDIDYQAYRPSIVFLNGEYWGIHNIREMIGDDYIQENHGFDKNNLDLLSQTGSVKEGDFTNYEELLTFVRTHDLRDSDNYEWVMKRIDIQEYINYNIAQIYFSNYDWPAGNIKYWRPRIPDGIWRWIIFDLDLAFQYSSFNSMNWATRDSTPDSPGSTDLFRLLLTNPDFSHRFVQTFQYHLNTTFQPGRVIEIIDSLQANIDHEMKTRHIKRWEGHHGWTFVNNQGVYIENPWLASYDQWLINVEELRGFARKRNSAVWGQLQTYFNLDEPVDVTFRVQPPLSGSLDVNSFPVASTEITYSCFPSDSLLLTAVASPLQRFNQWEIRSNTLEPDDTVMMIGSASYWKYLDTGVYPATNWHDQGLSDAWKEGRAILGYNNDRVSTNISYGSDPAAKHITYLFEKKFKIQSARQWSHLYIGLLRDDGAVVYLNGREVIRSNMPSNSDFFTTALTGVNGPDEVTYFPYEIPVELLRNGDNCLSVEVHQVSSSSSDLTFDLSLTGVVGIQDREIQFSSENPIKINFEWPSEVYAYFSSEPSLPPLKINEAMPANMSFFKDRLGSCPYWIEIFNPGPDTWNLAGLCLTNDLAYPGKWTIPVGNPVLTTVPPNGYVTLVADDRPFLGPDHLGFSIGRELAHIGLALPTGSGYIWIDTLTVPMQDADVSYGRFPDGAGERATFTQHPTPGAPNVTDFFPPVEKTALLTLFPNPFRENLHISFSLTNHSPVLITVRSLGGVLLKTLINTELPSGQFSVEWNGRNAKNQKLPPGIYCISMIHRTGSDHGKVLLMD